MSHNKFLCLLLLLLAVIGIYIIYVSFIDGSSPFAKIPRQNILDNVPLPLSAAKQEIAAIIRAQAEEIEAEMSQYSLGDLSALAPHLGGSPKRVMVAATWRSGSTFLGDILLSHPALFYHYEPLLHFEIQQVRDEGSALAKEAIRTLTDLFNCRYERLDNYLAYGRTHWNLLSHNERVWRHCWTAEEDGAAVKRDVCFTPDFLSRSCELFPFQSMKTVRLRLNLTTQLLDDRSLNLRVLLLVRDPRATLHSRTERAWCPGQPDCEDPARLCADMVDDYRAAQRMQASKAYKDRLRVVRYEDMSLNPVRYTAQILSFFGLDASAPPVRAFLHTHTSHDSEGRDVSSTFRDSKTAPFRWLKQMSFARIREVQSVGACAQAIKLWGYKLIHRTKAQLIPANPLKNKTAVKIELL